MRKRIICLFLILFILILGKTENTNISLINDNRYVANQFDYGIDWCGQDYFDAYYDPLTDCQKRIEAGENIRIFMNEYDEVDVENRLNYNSTDGTYWICKAHSGYVGSQVESPFDVYNFVECRPVSRPNSGSGNTGDDNDDNTPETPTPTVPSFTRCETDQNYTPCTNLSTCYIRKQKENIKIYTIEQGETGLNQCKNYESTLNNQESKKSKSEYAWYCEKVGSTSCACHGLTCNSSGSDDKTDPNVCKTSGTYEKCNSQYACNKRDDVKLYYKLNATTSNCESYETTLNKNDTKNAWFCEKASFSRNYCACYSLPCESETDPNNPVYPTNCSNNITWGNYQCAWGLKTFQENKNWKSCVFNDNSKRDYNLGDTGNNSYCPVYCVEDLASTLSENVPVVEAGEYFTWPNNSGGLYGTRYCQTKDVYFTRFQNELKQANEDIDEYYINYQLYKQGASHYASESLTMGRGCDPVYEYYSCPTEENPDKTCRRFLYYADNYYSYDGTTASFGGKTKTFSSGKACGYSKARNKLNSAYSSAKSSRDSYYNRYTNAKPIPSQLLQRMKDCYGNYRDSEVYNVNPTVTIDYRGANGNIYSYNGKLHTSVDYSSTKKNQTCTTTSVYVQTDYRTGTYRSVEKCTKVTAERSADVEYYLDSSVFRYVNKATAVSFHAQFLNQYKQDKYFNYYDIGKGNLPVSYGTKPGLYGSSVGRGNLSLYIDNFGHLENNSSRIENIITNDAARNGRSNYQNVYCSYLVLEGIACTTGNCEQDTNPDADDFKQKVIYRPIDLSNPFPDIDGNGRKTGTNWCYNGNCKNNNTTVKNVILDNRDVSSDEVYNLEPMYSFTLTPSIINQIRQYNKNSKYDDIVMTCDRDNKGNNVLGRHCISDYLDDLITLTNATGTCTQDRKTTFDSCRY